MKKNVGAVILAAGKSAYMEELRPLLTVGQKTIIQTELDVLRGAGISPIYVVTGYRANELEKHLSHRGVVFVRNEAHDTSRMLDSVKLALRAAGEETGRVLLFPADVPMVSTATVEAMAQAPGPAAVPVCGEKRGHPVMLESRIFPKILAYDGAGGLSGALESLGEPVRLVETGDPAVLMDMNTSGDYEELVAYEKNIRNGLPLRVEAGLTVCKPDSCFDDAAAGFLEAIDRCGSMLSACQETGVSYSKGWKMLKIAEESLGIRFLNRQTGGKTGGASELTEEGRAFLAHFRALEEKVRAFAEKEMQDEFREWITEKDGR